MVANIVKTCDTSFLVSLYIKDEFTWAATDLVTNLVLPLHISPFNDFELNNTLALMQFRGAITAELRATILANYQADLSNEIFKLERINLSVVLREARRIALTHTATLGFRSFDIFQVAAALTMNASHFLTFDARQARLAGLEHLETNLLEKR